MFTIIGGDGKEYGPVSIDQIRSWITAGRANLDTKVKKAGSETWQRLGDLPEFSATPAAAMAGTPPPMPAVVTDAKAFADDLRARGPSLDVFGTIGQGFELYKEHFLPLVGVTLLVVVLQLIAGAIPLLGLLSNLLLTGVFYGGLYYYYLGKKRGETREVGDAFAGFNRALVPLMLAHLVSSLIIFAVCIVCCLPVLAMVGKLALEHPSNPADFMPNLGPVGIAGAAIGGIILLYLSISWTFAFPLIIDQGLSPWTALEVSRRVVGKNWFRVFFLVLIAGFLTCLGLIGLVIGIAFTLPIIFCAITCAYETLFRPAPAATG